ncbi:hypothetical protein [Rubrivirga marina]|uniref:Uncharacterized protein n=1 Tax=Rubrivirga marina TaxID=1196024 RepID=A0A271J578_9BACT|nr:hypothetical protein [Rubrivirga marina]PAP78115.1 hypothetical protein BSZ37_17575 [Rubrivirga marina]
MRPFLLLLALSLLPVADGTASVMIDGDPAASFDDGHAYVLALDGFGVFALATAPLDGGSWAVPDDTPFAYVEVRVFGGIHEGEVALGDGASVVPMRWGPGGTQVEDAPAYVDSEGTLAFASVTDSLVTGTMAGTLTRFDADGTETRAPFDASFRAVPGQIPPP